MPEAGWRTDPSGRHELRYWDGTQWTEQVASGGVIDTDAVIGEAMTSQTAAPPTKGPSKGRVWPWVVAGVFLLLVAIVAIVLLAGGTDDEPSQATRVSPSTPTSVDATTVPTASQPTEAPSTVPPTTNPPAGLAGSGTFVVGRSAAPGVYVSSDNSACHWERSAAPSGGGAIIATDDVVGQALVQLQPGEVFTSTGCNQWALFEPPLEPLPSFADGTWAVPSQAAPGRWQAPGGPGCFWARLVDLSGSAEAVLASEYVEGPVLLDLDGSEAAFTSKNCGDWTPAN